MYKTNIKLLILFQIECIITENHYFCVWLETILPKHYERKRIICFYDSTLSDSEL